MGTDDASKSRHSSSYHKSGKMAVPTTCSRCQQPVVGVTIREMPGWCSIECKSCGHSSSLRHKK